MAENVPQNVAVYTNAHSKYCVNLFCPRNDAIYLIFIKLRSQIRERDQQR